MASVVITAPGTYKFAARVAPGSEEVGYINSIAIAPGVTGVVDVVVLRWDGTFNPGATDVHLLDLSGNADSGILKFYAANSAGRDGDIVASRIGSPNGNNFTVGSGPILHNVVVGHLNGDIWATGMQSIYVTEGTADNLRQIYNFSYQPWLGTVEVNGDLGDLRSWGDFRPTVHITGNVGIIKSMTGSIGSNITIDGRIEDYLYAAHHLSGSLTIAGDAPDDIVVAQGDLVGSVHIQGNVPGGSWIEVMNGNLLGDVTIDGSFAGEVRIGDVTQLEPPPADLTGHLTIRGDMTGGAIRITRYLKGEITFGDPENPAGQLTNGLVDVLGSFWDEAGDLSGGHINIYGSFAGMIQSMGGFAGSTEYVAIDANGGDLQDSWIGGYIKLGETLYSGNTPSMRLWDVSDCRGDFNSDWVIDIADLNLWFTALNNPGAYALAYPGLGTSRVFHGDTNCDGAFNGYDRASFLDRLARQCCDVSCPGCETLGRMPAGSFASELKGAVWPENYADLVAAVAGLAVEEPQPAEQAYWQAVYQGLVE